MDKQMTDTVDLGVDLLASADETQMDLSVAVDRIETLTAEPTTTRQILDEAEKRGVIERSKGMLRVRRSGTTRSRSQIVVRDGEFTCQRCGASISPGRFLDLDAGLHGAFGPECIRIVTGRTESD